MRALRVFAAVFSGALCLASVSADPADPGTWRPVIQRGHGSFVIDTAASENGELVASASADRTAKLWTTRGSLLRTLRGHGAEVVSVDLDPSGRHALTASLDGSTRLWRTMDGSTVWGVHPGRGENAVGPGSFTPCRRARFSPDGTLIAVACSNALFVLDLEGKTVSGGERGRRVGDGSVADLAWAPGGAILATASEDGTIALWTKALEPMRSWGASTGAVNRIAWTRDGRSLLTGDAFGRVKRYRADGTLERDYDGLASGKTPEFGQAGPGIASLALDGSGGRFLASTEDGAFAVAELATGSFETSRIASGASIRAAAPAPGGWVIGMFSTVASFDDAGVIAEFRGSPDSFHSVSSNPRYPFVSLGSFDGRAQLRSAEGKFLKAIEAPVDRATNGPGASIVADTVFHPSGAAFALVAEKPYVMGIDGSVLRAFENYADPGGFWSADGYVLTVPDGFGNVHERDLRSGSWKMEEPPERGGRHPSLAAVSRTGRVAYAFPDGAVLFGPRGGPWTERKGTIEKFSFGVNSLCFSPDGTKLAVMDSEGIVRVWDEAGRELAAYQSYDLGGLVLDPAIRRRVAPDGVTVSVPALEALEYWDRAAFGFDSSFYAKGRRLAFSPDGTLLASGGRDGTVSVRNAADGRLVLQARAHDVAVTGLGFSADGSILYSVAGACDVGMTKVSTGYRATLVTDGADWIVYDDDGYFEASRSGGRLVAMVAGTKAAAPDQFAAAFNRPDIVYGKLGVAAPDRLETWRAQFRKRAVKLGLVPRSVPAADFERIAAAASQPGGKALAAAYAKRGAEYGLADPSPVVALALMEIPPFEEYVERLLRSDRAVPVAEIVSAKRDGKRDGKRVELECRVSAPGRPLASYEIFVNGTPLHGSGGKPVSGTGVSFRERVELCPGSNLIELSCRDAAGLESTRDRVSVPYAGAEKGDLWFVGFGVSAYRNPDLTLLYPGKDVRDMASAFSALKGGYGAVHVLEYVDGACVPESFAAAKRALGDAKAGDTVVMFVSGHGAHVAGPDASYYFLTRDADPADLAGTAVDFDAVEGVLDGIAPRKKLLLIDTCESGELDEALLEDYLKRSRKAGISARTAGGTTLGAAKASKARPWVRDRDRFVWNDLRRRTGAVVFSSCGGGELSYEPSAYFEGGNGFFTSAVLRALRGGAADADGDGTVGIEELRAFVTAEVTGTSGGLQSPTIDRDNALAGLSFPTGPR